MRVGNILSVLGFFVLASNVSAEGPAEHVMGPLPESEYRSYQNCGLDTDCVVVQNGCCDCANGGKDIAINKLQLQKFKARFNCDQIMCTMMAAAEPCGSGVVSCVANKCHYEAKVH